MRKAVIIVSHDHRTREVANRIAWLEDGTFRGDVLTERDPVCQRVVEVEGAPSFVFASLTYHFVPAIATICSRR